MDFKIIEYTRTLRALARLTEHCLWAEQCYLVASAAAVNPRLKTRYLRRTAQMHVLWDELTTAAANKAHKPEGWIVPEGRGKPRRPDIPLLLKWSDPAIARWCRRVDSTLLSAYERALRDPMAPCWTALLKEHRDWLAQSSAKFRNPDGALRRHTQKEKDHVQRKSK